MLEKYGKESPSRRQPLSRQFAFSRLSHLWATFFGVGLLKPAPGTWGTVAAALVFAAYQSFLPFFAEVAIALFTVATGIWACEQTVRDAGVPDHGSIVIDEVAAVWLFFPFLPPEPLWWLAGIAVFRFYDIFKIWPVGWLDRNLEGGLGVMIDDVVASFYSGLTLILAGAFLL